LLVVLPAWALLHYRSSTIRFAFRAAPTRRITLIKSISLLTRRPEISHEEFVRHWVEIHAPLAHAVPRLQRYVQSHIVAERTRADIETLAVEIDGIAELWYESVEDLRFAMTTPEAKILHDDGATFIGKIKTFTIEEKVIVPAS